MQHQSKCCLVRAVVCDVLLIGSDYFVRVFKSIMVCNVKLCFRAMTIICSGFEK